MVNPEEQYLVFHDEAPVQHSPLWYITLCLAYFIGGTTFILGTSCYFDKNWHDGGEIGSVLFIIGSVSFLIADTMEIVASSDDVWIRLNLSLSVIGSIFYVMGSIGFIPSIFNQKEILGATGFIIGSILIGSSQIWKVIRTGTENDKFSFQSLCTDGMWMITSVDICIGLGGWLFFIGSVMFISGPLEGPWYESVLFIWMIGSIYYTIGALFLCYASYQLIYGIQDDKNSDDSWDRVK